MASDAGVQLDLILTAEIKAPHGYVYRAEGELPLTGLLGMLRPGGTLRLPCIAYAVRHPAAGAILIDTGMHQDARESLRRDFGTPMSVMFRGLRPAELPFDQQLRQLSIEPNDIEQVVMTHLHVDHTSGMRLLPRTEFTCAREEWTAARSRFAVARGYVQHHLPPAARMRLVDFEADGEPYGPFEQTIDLLGDGSIRLISTPGHTPGHLSVLLRLDGGREVLVVGDAAYTLRNIREGILPLITADDQASLRSLGALKAFADSRPEVTLVPTHDPDAWRQLRPEGSVRQHADTAG